MNRKYPVRRNDIEVADRLERMGRPFEAHPFRTAVSMLGSGENIPADAPSAGHHRGSRRHLGVLLRKFHFIHRKYLSKNLREEFGM